MIDLEFSKYDDPRDTIYGPYRCTCAPKHKCQACTENPTVHTCAYPPSRLVARADAQGLNGPATRTLHARRTELYGFLARWLAEHGQFPLPSEMERHSQSRPRPDWARSPTLVYYAYERFNDWYDDCLAQGIGTALNKQQAAARLSRLRGNAQRKRRKHTQEEVNHGA